MHFSLKPKWVSCQALKLSKIAFEYNAVVAALFSYSVTKIIISHVYRVAEKHWDRHPVFPNQTAKYLWYVSLLFQTVFKMNLKVAWVPSRPLEICQQKSQFFGRLLQYIERVENYLWETIIFLGFLLPFATCEIFEGASTIMAEKPNICRGRGEKERPPRE